MPLTAGTRLGPYEIVAAVGQGGMGEVYKATDTRLNRTVAIKVMPPHFADNPDMKQRFDREAQTIAGLNHPNICTLHDVGTGTVPAHEAGLSPLVVSYLVMEFLEGETLADRISRGAIDLADAIGIAAAIADALDKAHRKGIVHRDLKPANIMLVKSGGSMPLVKLLDFGLAKWVARDAGSLGAMQTRTDLSSPGMILGTLQYMAPEQVEGKEADARTDIFGFGAVVYEMITGQRAFQGKSQATLISAIMTGEPPPLSTLQPMAPAALDHVIRRCLAKDPEDRWQDAHSLLVQLQWIAQGRTESEVPASVAAADRKRAKLLRIALVTVSVVTAALAVPAVLYLRGPDPPEAFPLRVPVVGLSRSNIAISPNGREIAVVAQPDSAQPAALYVRPVHTPTFRRLAGTDDGTLPFWSADSRSIAFVTGGMLKRVDATGGAPKDIAPVPDFAGGAWNAANTIVFGSPRGLYRVSAEGGTPEALTAVEKAETGHFWPSFLPDGNHFLFLAWSADAGNRTVYAGALDSKDRTKVLSADSNALFASGHILFHRAASLFAQPFDAASLTIAGDPKQVTSELAFSSGDGRGLFDASGNGVLIFYEGESASSRRGQTAIMQFGWIVRKDRRWSHPDAIVAGPYGDMDVSPDERFVALTKQESGAPGSDIVVVDWEKNNETRLTFDLADDINPVWSNDGSRIAFTSFRKGNADIFVKNANGVGEETVLAQSAADEFVEAWSRDGRHIAYLVGNGRFQDIYALPLGEGGKPFPVVQGPFRKDEPQFSHDGKWLAYTSDESAPGKFEVYVVSFPQLDQKRKISIDGGGQPRWARDGKELFFRKVTHYMVADFMPGPKVDSGVPRIMFLPPTGRGGNASSSDPIRHQWAAAADGQRFLVRMPPGIVGRDGRGRSMTPAAVNTFSPDGSTVAIGPGPPPGARGGGGRGGLSGHTAPVLTVILHWPAGLGKGGTK